MTQHLWLIPVGVLLGAFGTLVGAGGGFLLVPLLLLVYPAEDPGVVTSISLAVVGLNALSGSVSYARMKRIDYRSGVLFAFSAVPGSVLGAVTTTWLPRHGFDRILGVALLLLAVFLLWRPGCPTVSEAKHGPLNPAEGAIPAADRSALPRYNPRTGALLSVLVGYLSTLLGIGGGIIHVPMLVQLLDFPVHVATATSHFVLAFTAGTGTVVHIVSGAFHHGVRRTLALGIGVMLGAPLGAALSRRVRGTGITRGLALALALVGLRLLFLPLG